MSISWVEGGRTQSLRWQSEAGVVAPKRVLIADDSITADTAYRLACEGTAMLWRGDFHNARQLLQAMAKRCELKKKSKKNKPGAEMTGSSDNLYARAEGL